MPNTKRLRLCGCIALAVASLGLIGIIIAQPLLGTAWSPAVTTAQLP